MSRWEARVFFFISEVLVGQKLSSIGAHSHLKWTTSCLSASNLGRVVLLNEARMHHVDVGKGILVQHRRLRVEGVLIVIVEVSAGGGKFLT